MYKKKVFLTLAVLCAVGMMAGCTKDNADLIIGKWMRQSPTENDINTFTDNDDYIYGSVVFGDMEFSKNNSATISFATTQTIPLNWHTISCSWYLNDKQDELTLSSDAIGTVNFVVQELSEVELTMVYVDDQHRNTYKYKRK